MITGFILNNKTVRTREHPGNTLLDFIRYDQNLTGTKIGCREGDCGACTVLLGEERDGRIHYQSMTSCVTPLGNANGKHVVTIEGLNLDDLTPVQKAFVDMGGTQCGFCTVGFVVSLTGYCLAGENPTLKGAISAMDGNICRCTGYKSIERAAEQLVQKLHGSGNSGDTIPWLVKNGFLPPYFTDIPERLKKLQSGQSKQNGLNGNTVIGGGTDLFVQRHDDMFEEDLSLVFDRREMNRIEKRGDKIITGASATPSDMMKSTVMQELFPELWNHLKLVSSTQIRNMGTLAGNFANASPIGDMTAWFLALNSSIILRDKTGQEREMKLKEFYLDYKVLNKKEDELITKIIFQVPELLTKFNFEKVSKRKYLDIATVNSAIQVRVDGDIITHINLSAGGVAPIPKFLSETCKFMTGKSLSCGLLVEANDVIQSEISPISDVRGSAGYKRLLLRQLFFAHFIELYPELIRPAELV
ncbi:MAG: FAD binding domain-containing protein [Balneolaceae bacterium]